MNTAARSEVGINNTKIYNNLDFVIPWETDRQIGTPRNQNA